MKLAEKIIICRKKAGLSQEALADRIGVSRQAISKWETGESAPEIGKLAVLAKTFGVTTDWLLSETDDEPQPDFQTSPNGDNAADAAGAAFVNAVPGVIGRLGRRFGWLAGVYFAVAGAVFTLIGLLSRVMSGMVFSTFGEAGTAMPTVPPATDDLSSYSELGSAVFATALPDASSLAENNPVALMGTVMMIVGAVMIIAGIILAAYLKRKNVKKSKN